MTLAEVLADADDLVVQLMNLNPMVGLAVGVVHDGELVYSKGFGLADSATQRPVTPETTFLLASISKTFTGIGIMQLVERGLVDLDDPVTQHLSSFAFGHPAGERPPTVRDLLTHTSGVGELRAWADVLQGATGGLSVREGRRVPSLTEHYAKGLRAEVAAGGKWAYANHAFSALGQLIEDVTGQPFAEYMDEHVFAPLGMKRTTFERNADLQLAVGHGTKKGTVRAVPFTQVVTGPAGGAFSCIDDLALYATALLNGGRGLVLRPETLQSMFASHWTSDPRLPGMGLSFLREVVGGYDVVWHDGGWPGYSTSLLLVPSEGLAVIALSNSRTGAHTVAEGLLRSLLGVPQVGDELPRAGIPESPQVWKDLVGLYAAPRGVLTSLRIHLLLGGELRVSVRGGHLMARSLLGPMSKGVRLFPVSADDPLLFDAVGNAGGAAKLPVRLAFARGADGTVQAVSGVQLIPFQLVRRPVVRSVRVLARAALAAAALATAVRRAR